MGNKDGVLIDVGAHHGSYSRLAVEASRLIRVYAFEPHPRTFVALKEQVSQLNNVVAFNMGMASEEGRIKLYDYADSDGSSHASVFKEVISDIHGSERIVEHEIMLTTLDEFLDREKIENVTLLKIDTEGNELAVLRGARRALSERRIKAIHFEFNEMNVASRAFFRDFWKLLSDYRFFRMLPSELLEIEF